jgi:predicted permease
VRPYAKADEESLAGKDRDNINRKAASTPLDSVIFLIVAVLWDLIWFFFKRAFSHRSKTDGMILVSVVFGPTCNTMLSR